MTSYHPNNRGPPSNDVNPMNVPLGMAHFLSYNQLIGNKETIAISQAAREINVP